MADETNESLFRKKSLDKVKSPENLDDYIQVSKPGVWLLLISVVVLLVGACVWGVFGQIESTVETSIRAENGTVVCYIADSDISSIQNGMTVKFSDYEAVVAGIVQKDGTGYVFGLQSNQTIPEGFYKGKVVVKSVKPISFVLN